MAITLGPFALSGPIGKGGMGEVWQGVHVASNTPIALKVMTGALTEHAKYIQAFRHEVRAVASLDHPSIVWVLETGTVDRQTAASSRGRLPEGAPWLAMELATGGTLHDVVDLRWRNLSSILHSLLDALSHAHARGVIHRDLKPGNVLFATPNDVRPGLKLTDFGIAHAGEADQLGEGGDELIGTLQYMAPEQIRGDWRDLGPWTDLYATGCLAWKLATGHLPFQGKNRQATIFAHLTKQAPAFEPLFPVPDGFEDWLRALLSKSAAHRFQRAADASAALLSLGHVDADDGPGQGLLLVPSALASLTDPSITSPGKRAAESPTIIPSGTLYQEALPTLLIARKAGLLAAAANPELAPPSMALSRPALPQNWRRTLDERWNIQLAGAGLGLLGVRCIPLVGRSNERDRAWEALRRVHADQHARLVLLRGAAGMGRTRLGEWLAERAHEVGAAEVLRATVMPGDSPGEAFMRACRERFRLNGLTGDALSDRVRSVVAALAPSEPQVELGLRALLDPSAEPERVEGDARHVMQRVLLEHLAQQRPVVLLFDDAHLSVDVLRFVRHVLNAQAAKPAPLWLVVTVREDPVDPNALASVLVDDLCERDDCQRIDLGPLAPRERASLVEGLLGLDPALGAQIEARSEGNPAFAVQLIQDWVSRDLLEPSPRGFRLRDGAQRSLPESVAQVWGERLRDLLAELPRGCDKLLELAAVFGQEVDDARWQQACDDPDQQARHEGRMAFSPVQAKLRAALVARLSELHLAEDTPSGWRFRQAMFREAVLAHARQQQRLAAHHAVCASVMETQLSAATSLAYGRHLLGAGALQAAVTPLLRGIKHELNSLGGRAAAALLEDLGQTMNQAGLKPADPRRQELLALQARAAESAGDLESAVNFSRAAARAADAGKQPAEAVEARVSLGKLLFQQGRMAAAEGYLSQAIELLEAHPDAAAEGRAWFWLGRVARAWGDLTEGDERLRRAADVLSTLEGDEALAERSHILAEIAWNQEQWSDCREHAITLLQATTRLGNLGRQSTALNLLSEAERGLGDLDAAVDALVRAIALTEISGDNIVAINRCNLALIYISRQQWGEAYAELKRALSTATAAGRPSLLAASSSVLVPVTAALGLWGELDRRWADADRIQRPLGEGERDTVRCMELAAEHCLAANQVTRALACLDLARDQAQKLGDTPLVESITRRMAHLSDA